SDSGSAGVHPTGQAIPAADPADLRASLPPVFESPGRAPENAVGAADPRAQVRLRTRRRQPQSGRNLRAAEPRILRRPAWPAAARLEPAPLAGNAGAFRSVA